MICISCLRDTDVLMDRISSLEAEIPRQKRAFLEVIGANMEKSTRISELEAKLAAAEAAAMAYQQLSMCYRIGIEAARGDKA